MATGNTNSPITFTIIEEATIILRGKGVFKQAKVYMRKGLLYAGYGSGFVRLNKNTGGINGTSVPNLTYDDLYLPFPVTSDNMGRLIFPS